MKKIAIGLAILSGLVLLTVAEEGAAPAKKDGKENPKSYRTMGDCCYCCRNSKLEGAVDGYWGIVDALRIDANSNTAHIKFKCGSFVGKEKPFQMGNQAPDGMDPKTQDILIKKEADGTLKVYFLPKEPSTPEEFQAARNAKKAFYYADSLSPSKFVVDAQPCLACKGTGKITEKVTENVKTKTGSGKNAKTVEEPKTVNKTEKCNKCNGTGAIPVEWDPPVISTLAPLT